MFSEGLSDGRGPTVPVTLIGIPFRVPSVLVRVRFLLANEKFITGLVIFWSIPENSGLLNEPEITGFDVLPLTFTEAVIFPANL